MTDAADAILTALILVIVGLPVPATMANAYLWYWQRKDRASWLLRDFAVIASVVNAVAVYFGVLATLRLLGGDPIPWAPPISALAAIALECVPIFLAWEFWTRRGKQRRRAGDGNK